MEYRQGDRLDVRRYEGVCQAPEMPQQGYPVLHTGLLGELVSLEIVIGNLESVAADICRKIVPPTPTDALSPNPAFSELPTMRVCAAKDRLRAVESVLQEINREIGE